MILNLVLGAGKNEYVPVSAGTNEVGGSLKFMTDASRAPTSRRELLSSLLSQKAGSL